MNIPLDPPGQSLGADIRALRRSRGLTLAQMAGQLNRSIGWLSQVERDKSSPDIDELRRIAEILQVPLSLLFGANPSATSDQGRVVRSASRRRLGSRVHGLEEELLSPDLTDDFEMVHSVFAPGATMAQDVTRPTQEVAYVVSGRMDLTIGGTDYTVGEGDSFRIRGEAYRWANPYSQPCVVIWVIAPPIY